MMKKIFSSFFIILGLSFGAYAQVTVTSSDSISCSTLCTTLTANVIGDNPTDAGITEDDIYSPVIPIGFNFVYFGTSYSSCTLGANGTIDFDITDAGSGDPWPITAALAGNPSKYNNICGAWCDIDIFYTGVPIGTETYSTEGTAPFRKFVVSWCGCSMFQCSAQRFTTQIILYETTNVIEVHLARKDICTSWNPSSPAGAGGRGIIGVEGPSSLGGAAVVAPGRDWTPVWGTINEAWRFTPAGAPTYYTCSSIPYAPIPLASSLIYWYNATTGAFLGTGATLNVCPTTTTTYKAGALTCADTSFGYYTVVPSAVVTANFTVSAPILTCGNTTSITVSGLMPDSSYQLYYTFNGIPYGPVTFTASPTGTYIITGAAAGSYTNMYVSHGICSSAPQSLTIDPPPITITATPHNPSVCGYLDGYLVLTGYNPLTSYVISYIQNGVSVAGSTYTSNGAGAITVTGLPAGSYTNIASTGGPCPPATIAGPVTITDPPPPTVSLDSTYVKTCVGSPVQLHAYASPTGIPYTYSWSPATGLSDPNISNPIVTPTSTGNTTYIVTVNPSPGVPSCASTATLTVHTIGDFIIPTAPANICLTTPLDTVQASVSGSTEMTYVWTPTADVSPATGMATVITPTVAGTHIYTVTGSYAHCPDYVHTYTVTVDIPPTGIIARDTICLGMSDVVDMSASGGAGYHYLWTSSPTTITFSNDTLPNPVFTPGAIGTYTLSTLVSSPNNVASCGVRDTVFLLVLPNSMTISPTDTAICAGQVLQVTGTLAYSNLFTYQWLPTAGIASPDILNALITPDTSQVYTVIASFHRCPDIYATLNLDVQPNPTVYIGGNRTVCQFDTLHLHASVSPAWYDNYIYAWTPSTVLDDTIYANAVFTGTVSTKVIVTVTTPAGCIGKDSADINVNPGNFASVITDDDFCPHQSKTINVSGPAGATFRWYPSMYVSDSTSSTPLLSPITTQSYSIVVTSAAGCNDTVYWTATVYPDALIELGDDSVTLYPGESYTMSPSTNCVSFNWFPVTGLSSPFISNPVAVPDVSTEYIVTGTTEHGCVASDSIIVNVNTESLLAMPNAFTPGNGANASFKVILKGIASLNYFRVYNRWGNLMFETKDMNEGWDGTYKGEPQGIGVYVYDVQAVTSTGKIVNKTGNVTLLR